MRRNLQRRLIRSSEAGYTLTEMLVVIGIISLIAAVLTPSLMGQLSRSRAKAAQLQLDTVVSSVELFRADTGRYPTDAEGLKALVTDPGAVEGWTGPYLRDSRSLQDPWNDPFVYKRAPDERSFQILSLGADGKPGGSGLNRDLQAPKPAA